MPQPTTRKLIELLQVATAAMLMLLTTPVAALNNGLALTPPMGWLAWERFVCETNCDRYPDSCISERLFVAMADRLVEDGFAELGYTYVNIDDCWSEKRRSTNANSSNKLMPNAQRFPSGLGALSSYMHRRNLKLGIYGDCGTETCQLFPGQLAKNNSLLGNYFDLDANTFAFDWQVDSFKFDACNVDVAKSHVLCPKMADSLNATGRPILFSCSWPAYENDERVETDFALVASKCNLWRAFGDIEDSWRSVLDTIDWFVLKQQIVVKFHGPGGWFDADQLVIGNFGLSKAQEQAHMAIWCIWSAPLYMSNDLRSINDESSKLLRNKWLIEVDQDKFGVFSLMLETHRDVQAFVKPIGPISSRSGCPSYAIAYLNRATLGDSKFANFNLGNLISNLHSNLTAADPNRFGGWSACHSTMQYLETKFSVHDLVNNNAKLDLQPTLADKLELLVEPSGVRLVKLVELVDKVEQETNFIDTKQFLF